MFERAISWWRGLTGGGSRAVARPFRSAADEPRGSAGSSGRHRRGHVTALRTREVAQLLAFVRDWAPREPAFRAIALTGSWANDTASMESDIDLICLSDAPAPFLSDLEWTAPLGYVEEAQPHRWGGFAGLSIALESGLVIDWGFAPIAWAATNPVDPTTRRVVETAFSPIHDPDRLLARLVHACDVLTAAEYRELLTNRD